jgi:predicted metalloprotease
LFPEERASERQEWFLIGYNSGQIEVCDTFNAER